MANVEMMLAVTHLHLTKKGFHKAASDALTVLLKHGLKYTQREHFCVGNTEHRF